MCVRYSVLLHISCTTAVPSLDPLNSLKSMCICCHEMLDNNTDLEDGPNTDPGTDTDVSIDSDTGHDIQSAPDTDPKDPDTDSVC